MGKKFFISTEIDGDQLVESTIVTALEGGSNYWYWVKCDEHWFEVAKRYDKTIAATEEPKREQYNPLSIRISNALLNVQDFEMNIYDLESPDEKIGKLTLSSFVSGCEMCALNYPEIWERLVGEDYDADDADILFQLATLGEVVYG